MLDELSGEWYAFQQCLIDSDVMLKKSKEKFKTGLLLSAEEFKKTTAILMDEFRGKGPFSSSVPTDKVRTGCGWVGWVRWGDQESVLRK